MAFLVDDPAGKTASKICHDQPDIERSDHRNPNRVYCGSSFN